MRLRILVNLMNENIAKLSEIEMAADAIVKNADIEKTKLEKTMQDKRDAFDAEIEESTMKKVNVIRDELKEKMTNLLEAQKNSNRITIKQLEEDFEKNHKKYANSIFERIIEV